MLPKVPEVAELILDYYILLEEIIQALGNIGSKLKENGTFSKISHRGCCGLTIFDKVRVLKV